MGEIKEKNTGGPRQPVKITGLSESKKTVKKNKVRNRGSGSRPPWNVLSFHKGGTLWFRNLHTRNLVKRARGLRSRSVSPQLWLRTVHALHRTTVPLAHPSVSFFLTTILFTPGVYMSFFSFSVKKVLLSVSFQGNVRTLFYGGIWRWHITL